MKTAKLEGGAVVVSDTVKNRDGSDGATVWTMAADQAEKQRPQFAAELDKMPKADRDKLAELAAEKAGR